MGRKSSDEIISIRIRGLHNCKNIDVIHAHTPYRVGIPAQKAAKKTGKKFVYEVRGIWEETVVANGRWKRNGLAYSRFRRFENRILNPQKGLSQSQKN